MMLYVNGDSHTAGAEATNQHAFAEDDPNLEMLGRLPHPDNVKVSWGKKLSELIKYSFFCDAESAASNTRIIRTTKDWIENTKTPYDELLVIIGWSTWEREEWLVDNEYYQIGASGIDDVPDSHKDKYKEFVSNVDWKQKTYEAYENIKKLHNWLENLKIKHIFFNCNNNFKKIKEKDRMNWGYNYISPYTDNGTYDAYLDSNGYDKVTHNSWHYGADAHAAWARFLLKYIVENKIITTGNSSGLKFNRI